MPHADADAKFSKSSSVTTPARQCATWRATWTRTAATSSGTDRSGGDLDGAFGPSAERLAEVGHGPRPVAGTPQSTPEQADDRPEAGRILQADREGDPVRWV